MSTVRRNIAHLQGELCRLRRDIERHERPVGAEKDGAQRSDDAPPWQRNLGKCVILPLKIHH